MGETDAEKSQLGETLSEKTVVGKGPPVRRHKNIVGYETEMGWEKYSDRKDGGGSREERNSKTCR